MVIEILAVAATAILVIFAVVDGPPAIHLQFWDDAYIFARYADQLRATGKLSWNAAGPPTYGVTSILYTVVVVFPARLALPENAAVAVVASSITCMVAFLALALWLAWRVSDGHSRWVRWTVLLLIAASLSAARHHLNEHATSGMDTAFAMAYLTAYFIVAEALQRAMRAAPGASRKLAVALGLLGGLAIGARPDLILFTIAIPLALWSSAAPDARPQAVLALVMTGAASLAWLGAARLYFHTALPLPFYAKTTGLYRDFNRAAYEGVASSQLLEFCRANAVLVAIVLAATLVGLRYPDRRENSEGRPAIVSAAIIAAMIFAIYYLCFVLQIMYHAARFYYPILPALILAGAHEAARLCRRGSVRRWGRNTIGAGSLALAVLLAPRWAEVNRPLAGVAGLDVWDSARTLHRRRWFALDQFSRLPDEVVIAATEVGHVAAMNPGKTIIDYAGLNDRAFARQPFSAERLCAMLPDLVYLPHPDYRGMIADLLTSPTFAADYDLHSAEELGSRLGLALRRKSAWYDQMNRILVAEKTR